MEKNVRYRFRRFFSNRMLALLMAVLTVMTGVAPFLGTRADEVYAAELILEDAAVAVPPFNEKNYFSAIDDDISGRIMYAYYFAEKRCVQVEKTNTKEWFMMFTDTFGISEWGIETHGQTILDNTADKLSYFSDAEQNVMKTQSVAVTYGTGSITAKLFPISKDEWNSIDSTGRRNISSKLANHAWTRTGTGNEVQKRAYYILPGGNTTAMPSEPTEEKGINPCFGLDLTKVYLITEIGSNTRDYKFTIADNSVNSLSSDISGKKIVKAQTGKTYAIPYTNINTSADADGGQKYISIIIYDEDGKIVKYEKLTNASNASGTVNFTIPSDLSIDKEYTLALFEETVYSGNETNYCSTPVYAALTLTDQAVQTGIKAEFEGQVTEGKNIPKSKFAVCPVYSDGSKADNYSDNDFYVIKTEDYNNLDAETINDKNLFSQAAGVDALTADTLAEGTQSSNMSITVVAFNEEFAQPFSTVVNVTIKARSTEDDLMDQYGSWEAVADKIKELEDKISELEEKLADAEDRIDGYQASIDNIQGQLNDETSKNQTLEETLANLNQKKSDLQKQYEALEDTTSEQAQTIKDQIAALEEKEKQITDLQNQVQEIQQDIKDLQSEAESYTNAFKEILAKVNEMLEADQKLDGSGSDNAQLKVLIMSGLTIIQDKLTSLEESLGGITDALEDALGEAGIDISEVAGGADSLTGSSSAETYQNILAAITKLIEKYKTLENNMADAAEQIDGYKAAIDNIQEQLDSETSKNETLEETLENLRQEKSDLQDQYDALEDTTSEQAKTIKDQITALEEKEKQIADLQKQVSDIQDSISQLQSEAKDYERSYRQILALVNEMLKDDQKQDGEGSDTAQLKIQIAAGLGLVKQNIEALAGILNGIAGTFGEALAEMGIDIKELTGGSDSLIGSDEQETYQNIQAAAASVVDKYNAMKKDYDTIKKAVLGDLPEDILNDKTVDEVISSIEDLKQDLDEILKQIQDALGEQTGGENKKTLDELLEDIKQMKELLDSESALLDSVKAALGVSDNDQILDAIAKLFDKIDALVKENESLRKENKVLKENGGSTGSQPSVGSSASYGELLDKINALTAENAALVSKVSGLTSEIGVLKNSLDEKDSSVTLNNLLNQNSTLTDKNKELTNQVNVLTNKNTEYISQVNSLNIENKELREDNAALKASNESLEHSNKELNSKNHSLQEVNTALTSKYNQLKMKYNQLKAKYDNLKAKYHAMKAKYAAASAGEKNLQKQMNTLKNVNTSTAAKTTGTYHAPASYPATSYNMQTDVYPNSSKEDSIEDDSSKEADAAARLKANDKDSKKAASAAKTIQAYTVEASDADVDTDADEGNMDIMSLVESENIQAQDTKKTVNASETPLTAATMSTGTTAVRKKSSPLLIIIILVMLAGLIGAGAYCFMKQQNGGGKVKVKKKTK